ncbi:MAG TPA: DUF4255 domain-containing protein [Thermoanaerobaculia bacterium]|nr:DUF4255 domain-containing protein [Thermoanaerobaculia bacterium]
MFDDLDKSIENLLKRELPADLVSQVTISFATPDNSFPPSTVSLPAIDLFLYDIRENRDLRDGEWRLERQSDGSAVRKAPLVRVDCSYLVTAWPSDSSPAPAKDEHRLLGEVMKALLRHSSLPATVLEGSLQGQEPPLPSSTLQPGRLQSLAEFWQAVGGKPKATLSYTVTLGVEPTAPFEAGPPVREAVFKMEQGV